MAISDDGVRRVLNPDTPVPPTAQTSPPWGGERLIDIRPPLHAEAVATSLDAARLRHELAGWLALDVFDEPLDDLVLATYEAIANAAEHAYADHPHAAGLIRLSAHRSHNCVTVAVADEGKWRIRPARASAAAVLR
jgi:anti-sigma regulatory factor (Ser/Thr protein kinase)